MTQFIDLLNCMSLNDEDIIQFISETPQLKKRTAHLWSNSYLTKKSNVKYW